MKRPALAIGLLLWLTTFSAIASPYDLALCPLTGGVFSLRGNDLIFTIDKMDGKSVKPWVTKVVNALEPKSNGALAKRGEVEVEIHKADGGVFVHWGTLRDAK